MRTTLPITLPRSWASRDLWAGRYVEPSYYPAVCTLTNGWLSVWMAMTQSVVRSTCLKIILQLPFKLID